jgi:hypothetical protein
MTRSRVLNSVALLLGAVLLSAGVQTYAQSFTQPSAPPPGANSYAPLNTGPTAQVKVGGILAGAGMGNHTTGVAFGAAGGSIVAYYGNIEAKAAGSFVKAPALCIGQDCRTAWPGGVVDGGDDTTLQKRITGTCTVGSSITAVNADGTVVCGPKIQWGRLSATSSNRDTSGVLYLRTVSLSAPFGNVSYSVSVTPSGSSPQITSQSCIPVVTARAAGSFTMATSGQCDGIDYLWMAAGN